MSPVVLTLSFFQALDVEALEHTHVGVQSPTVESSRISFVVLPVARLHESIGVNDKASATPFALSIKFSDVPSVELGVLLFSDRLVVHLVALGYRPPLCDRTQSQSHECVKGLRWEDYLKAIKRAVVDHSSTFRVVNRNK